LVAAAKFLFEATKNSFVVPNFVAVTKPFFSAPNDRNLKVKMRFLNLSVCDQNQ